MAVQSMQTLKAYQVGDLDIVAAYTPEGAAEVLKNVMTSDIPLLRFNIYVTSFSTLRKCSISPMAGSRPYKRPYGRT